MGWCEKRGDGRNSELILEAILREFSFMTNEKLRYEISTVQKNDITYYLQLLTSGL